ncbi:MAG TPA: DUF2065 domain-containing protein [Acidiferrobacterales bacterium]|jgi:uncharacterized protein YjeT (DUF2065 family)|nr:DUF2065 domain-containing protein [Acidiferrobacterales bacterium]
MWQDLGVAFALFLIIEGVVPFINPAGLRAALQAINQLSDQQLRFAGFTSMLLGLLLLYIVH